MKPATPELSVVIPAFNEENRLGASLDAALAYLEKRGLPFEVLVVDDGSLDRTVEVSRAYEERGVLTLLQGTNLGKGAALRRGVLESRGARVLFSDSDFSTPIEEIEKLEARLAEAEIAIGSRAVRDSEVTLHQPFYRELMGKTFNKVIRLAGVDGISDTQCGFKLLRGDVARELFGEMVTPGFAFDVELLWLARRKGYRIAEVGVVWRNSPDSRVHPLLAPPRMLLEIARFRWKHRGR